MKKLLIAAFALAVTAAVAAPGQGKKLGPPARDAFWVDDQLYRTIATPTSLPDRGPKDGLYVFTNLEGQRPVGEAKPGDQDYNGGRWQVVLLAFTEAGLAAHDPDDDGVANFELTNWEQVEAHIGLGHLEVAGLGPSFVCPVIK